MPNGARWRTGKLMSAPANIPTLAVERHGDATTFSFDLDAVKAAAAEARDFDERVAYLRWLTDEVRWVCDCVQDGKFAPESGSAILDWLQAEMKTAKAACYAEANRLGYVV